MNCTNGVLNRVMTSLISEMTGLLALIEDSKQAVESSNQIVNMETCGHRDLTVASKRLFNR